MKTTLFTFVLIFTFSFSANAQSNEDAAQKVVETYFDGYAKGDTTKLNTVFHPTFQLKWVAPNSRNKMDMLDREGLNKIFNASWSQLKISSEIIDKNVGRDAAFFKAEVTLAGIITWVDYISLLKIDNRWWIVSKISEGIPPRK